MVEDSHTRSQGAQFSEGSALCLDPASHGLPLFPLGPPFPPLLPPASSPPLDLNLPPPQLPKHLHGPIPEHPRPPSPPRLPGSVEGYWTCPCRPVPGARRSQGPPQQTWLRRRSDGLGGGLLSYTVPTAAGSKEAQPPKREGHLRAARGKKVPGSMPPSPHPRSALADPGVPRPAGC